MIRVLHTIPQSVEPLQRAFSAWPGLEVRHIVDQNIIRHVGEDGSLDDASRNRFVAAGLRAAEGADLLIIACTLCCRYAALLRQRLDIPVLEADVPMLRAVSRRSGRIGIVATGEIIAGLCENKLRSMAEEPLLTRNHVVASADPAEVQSACETLAQMGCDSIVLAQLSLAAAGDALTGISCPVYTAPVFLAETAAQTVVHSDTSEYIYKRTKEESE